MLIGQRCCRISVFRPPIKGRSYICRKQDAPQIDPNVRFGSRTVVAGRRMAQPVYPQFGLIVIRRCD
jgi:hypothetical protein